MIRHVFFIIVLPIIAFTVYSGNVCARPGVVVRVLDGDSLRVRIDGRVEEVRLYGIDAPEYGQAYGNSAKRYARGLADRKAVQVEAMDIDRYGRIVAVVATEEYLLNREMVRAGLAWHYDRYCRQQPLCGELERLENEAREKRRGLWRDKEPVPPWQWKRKEGRTGSHDRGGGDLRLPRWERILLGWLDR